jgi:hypothetical protein
VVDSDTGAYERVPGRRLALSGVALLATAGAVGTFLAATTIADAAPNTDLPASARPQAPSSAMAGWIDTVGTAGASAVGTASPGNSGVIGRIMTDTLATTPTTARPRAGTPAPLPENSPGSMMGATDEDDRCWWCDPDRDLPDRDGKPGDEPVPTPAPSPAATPTPTPSPSVDLSRPTSDG